MTIVGENFVVSESGDSVKVEIVTYGTSQELSVDTANSSVTALVVNFPAAPKPSESTSQWPHLARLAVA